MAASNPQTSAPLVLGSTTDRGRVRSSNEDACAALLAPNAPPGAGALLVVADGMGGHQAGEYASTLAVTTLVTRLRAMPAASFEPDAAARSLEAAVFEANARVHAEARSIDRAGMGTTLTAAIVAGPALAFAHVGDSRAYLLRGGQLALLTTDHTWVADRVRQGLISQEEASVHSRRNVLTRALGVSNAVEIDTAAVEILPGDTILLSSDGLHGPVTASEIAAVLEALPPQEAAAELVRRANEAGGPDNATAVVARVLSTTAPRNASGGSQRDAAPDATMTDSAGFGPALAGVLRRMVRRA